MCRDSRHLVVPWVVPWVLEICDYLYLNVNKKISGKNADTSWQSGRNRKIIRNNISTWLYWRWNENCKVPVIDVSRNLGHILLFSLSFAIIWIHFHHISQTLSPISCRSLLSFVQFSFVVVLSVVRQSGEKIRHLSQSGNILDSTFVASLQLVLTIRWHGLALEIEKIIIDSRVAGIYSYNQTDGFSISLRKRLMTESFF